MRIAIYDPILDDRQPELLYVPEQHRITVLTNMLVDRMHPASISCEFGVSLEMARNAISNFEARGIVTDIFR